MDAYAWRLANIWPQRLKAMPVDAAAAIETTALTVRMVASRLKHPGSPLPLSSEGAIRNPLLDFALKAGENDGPLSEDQQKSLLRDICTAFKMSESDLTFATLIHNNLMNNTFWDRPDLTLTRISYRNGKGQPWAPIETTGSTGQASLVQWVGSDTLESALATGFEMYTIPGSPFEYLATCTFPRILRVRHEPTEDSKAQFSNMRHAKLVAPWIREHEGGDGTLEVGEASAGYVLIGAIRHRRSGLAEDDDDWEEESAERVRFYDNRGLYYPPPPANDSHVPRPYVADDWSIGKPGRIYTLLYARGPVPYDQAAREFIPEKELVERPLWVNQSQGMNDFPQVPRQQRDLASPAPEEGDGARAAEEAAAKQVVGRMKQWLGQ